MDLDQSYRPLWVNSEGRIYMNANHRIQVGLPAKLIPFKPLISKRCFYVIYN